MKRLLLVVFVLALIPLVSAVPLQNPLCLVEGYGCYEGYTQLQCNTVPATLTSTYITDDTQPEYAQCALGCCIQYVGAVPSFAQERIMLTACQEVGQVFDTSEPIAGNCPATFNDIIVCAFDGDTDCRCGGSPISTGYVCCADTPTLGATCGNGTGSTPNPPNPFQNLCGNTVVDPVEECDPSFSDGSDVCSQAGLAPGEQNLCTPLCRCQFSPGQYQNDTRCNPGDSCSGTQTCQANAPPPTVNPAGITPGSAIVELSWSHPTTCINERVDYEILLNGTNGAGDRVTQRFSNLGVNTTSYNVTAQAGFSYTAHVVVSYSTGFTNEAPIFFGPFDQECLQGQDTFCRTAQQPVWCDVPGRLNEAVDQSACSGNQACFMTSIGAVCQPAVQCEECNAAYENFGEVRASYEVQQGMTCSLSTTIVDMGGVMGAYCVLDFNQSALKEYMSCSQIQVCADYQTQNTCENNGNSCQLAMPCTWNTTANLCTTPLPQFQRCTDAVNSLECSAIGACFWTNSECISASNITCNDFKTELSCAGPTNESFDANDFSNLGEPYSNDMAGLRKCKWLGVANGCIKDSDDNGAAELGASLLYDFTDPITTITSDTTQTYGLPIVLNYGVNEPVNKTYVGLYNNNCDDANWEVLTDDSSANPIDGTITLMPPPAEIMNGTYCVRYYSEDLARNREVVQQANITVNTSLLQIAIDYELFPDLTNSFVTIGLEINTTQLAPCAADIWSQDPPTQRAWLAQSYFEQIRDIPTTEPYVRVNVTCGTVEAEVRIPLAFDSRITTPQPFNNTMRSSNPLTQTISILAEGATLCEYDDGTNWVAMTQGVAVNGTHDRWRANAPSRAHGYYNYPVRCTLLGLIVDGEAGDTIIYAIDEQAPQLITEANIFGTIVNVSGNIEVNASGLTVNVGCFDPLLPGGGDDWEAGCGSPTSTGGVYRIQNGNRTKYPQSTALLQVGQSYTFIAVDELGNEGAPVTITGVQPTDDVRIIGIEVRQ